jgi:hypothetical protein
MQIGHHAIHQEGFRLSTPRETELGRATLGVMRQGRERERAQATAHQASSKRVGISMYGYISNRCLNQHNQTKTTWGPRLSSRGLRPQHSKRVGTRGRAKACNTRRRRQRKRTQRAMHQRRSEHTRTRRRRVFRDRRSNQRNISGNNGTHSSTQGARLALQEEKRVQEPGARSQEPGARARNECERHPHQTNSREEPDTRASVPAPQEAKVPRGRPRDQ